MQRNLNGQRAKACRELRSHRIPLADFPHGPAVSVCICICPLLGTSQINITVSFYEQQSLLLIAILMALASKSPDLHAEICFSF